MKKQAIVALILGTLGSVANAGEAAISFGDLDANKDNMLTSDETGALPGIADQWSSLDADADGQLSADEYAGYAAPAPAAGMDEAATMNDAK